MAQYNLVGYNSAPTNVEYEQMKIGAEKTPRTNWAEYSLKEKQLREEKKSNRFKNVLNMVNTVAEGVKAYEYVQNSELQRDTQELQNTETALDIQSKSIDVNKKLTENKKDLDYISKLSQYQKTGDLKSALALALEDPETAIRNGQSTKAIIAQARFSKTPGADDVYESLFFDEAKQERLDYAKFQKDIDKEYLKRDTKLMELNMKYGSNGTSRLEQQKAFTKALNKSVNSIEANPAASDGFAKKGWDWNQILSDPDSSWDVRVYDTEEILQQLDAFRNLEEAGKGDTFPESQMGMLRSVFGNNLPEDSYNARNTMSKTSQLVEFTVDGESQMFMMDRQAVKDVIAAKNSAIQRISEVAQKELTESYNGSLEHFGTAKLYALAALPKTTLKGFVEKYPHMLESATPAQRQTPAFQKLASAVSSVSPESGRALEATTSAQDVQDNPEMASWLKDAYNTATTMYKENPSGAVQSMVAAVRQNTPEKAKQKLIDKLSGTEGSQNFNEIVYAYYDAKLSGKPESEAFKAAKAVATGGTPTKNTTKGTTKNNTSAVKETSKETKSEKSSGNKKLLELKEQFNKAKDSKEKNLIEKEYTNKFAGKYLDTNLDSAMSNDMHRLLSKAGVIPSEFDTVDNRKDIIQMMVKKRLAGESDEEIARIVKNVTPETVWKREAPVEVKDTESFIKRSAQDFETASASKKSKIKEDLRKKVAGNTTTYGRDYATPTLKKYLGKAGIKQTLIGNITNLDEVIDVIVDGLANKVADANIAAKVKEVVKLK